MNYCLYCYSYSYMYWLLDQEAIILLNNFGCWGMGKQIYSIK